MLGGVCCGADSGTKLSNPAGNQRSAWLGDEKGQDGSLETDTKVLLRRGGLAKKDWDDDTVAQLRPESYKPIDGPYSCLAWETILQRRQGSGSSGCEASLNPWTNAEGMISVENNGSGSAVCLTQKNCQTSVHQNLRRALADQ